MSQLINISDPHLNTEDDTIAFGIDLGTTNSLIAMVDESNEIRVFTDEIGKDLIPSIVARVDNKIVVGNEVNKNNPNAIFSIKRFMSNIADCHYFLNPIETSVEILKKLCNIAKNHTGFEVKKAVITVPAYFDESARKNTKIAAQLAGIEVLRLLSEPTAAALAYNIDDSENQSICAVYDLGGGTFDVSILKLHKGVFQVLATGGDINLGGDDIDYEILCFILNKCNEQVLLNEQKSVLRTLLNNTCEIKKRLSVESSVSSNFQIGEKTLSFTITREDLKKITTKIVDRTIDIFFKTISDAKITSNDIDKIILVGGSTNIHSVKQKLREIFNNKVCDTVDSERIVVMGATLQAQYLTNNKRFNKKLVIDVLPLSLGIETFGGIVEKLIHRNSPIPAYAVQNFTTQVDGQNAIQIHICQGERETVANNKSLAKFDLTGIPPMPAGEARIQVEFKVDVDGLLTVTAVENTTGISKTIEVHSNNELTKYEITEKILDSVKNFDEDRKLYEIATIKMKAYHLINRASSAISENLHPLVGYDLRSIKERIDALKELLSNDELDSINSAIAELELQYSLLLERVKNC